MEEEQQEHVDKALKLIDNSGGNEQDKLFLKEALKEYCRRFEPTTGKKPKLD